MSQPIKWFEDCKLVAVIRSSSAEDAEARIKAASEGGLRLFEVSMQTPQVTRILETYGKRDDLIIGASGVTDGEMAERVIRAGANFISTPYTDRDIINVAKNSDCPVIQGALTPTEVSNAAQAGADLIKIYPVDSMGGLHYLKRLRQMMPSLKLIASGGVTLGDASDYLKQAVAVCIGVDLFPKQLIRSDAWAEITEKARVVQAKIDAMKVSR